MAKVNISIVGGCLFSCLQFLLLLLQIFLLAIAFIFSCSCPLTFLIYIHLPECWNPDVPNLPATTLKLYERIKQQEEKKSRSSEERSPSAPKLPTGWYSSDEEGDNSREQKDLEIITVEDGDEKEERKEDHNAKADEDNRGGGGTKGRRDPR